MSAPYQQLKADDLNDMVDVSLDDNLPKSPSILDPPSSKIEMKISSPPTALQDIKNQKVANRKTKKRRKSRVRPYINLRLKHITKLFDYQQIYFGCIAPLKDNYIDLHCNNLSECDLSYCCGLYMKVDKSFTIHTILSTEFITSLKKIILKKEKLLNKKLINNNDNIELKVNEKKKKKTPDQLLYGDDYSPSNFVAFHPRDHWEFAKDMEHKNCVIFIHGQNYAPDKYTAAQYIMNECLSFYADMPYLVIPFIWPCEGELVEYDANIIAEEYCGTELGTFIRRLWSLFERMDFVAHGKGCNILCHALKLLKKDKPDVIDMSHVILIAADIDYNIFINEYLNDIYTNVKRVTLYVNTWDWKLFSSSWWNWSSNRIGSVILSSNLNKKFDCIDVTQLLSGWFLTSNHYYLTNKYFKLDIIQSLSKIGGVDPKYRNYVLPVYDDTNITSSLLNSPDNIKYYELVDKPYMKIVPKKKQNINIIKQNINNNDNNSDTDMNTVTKNLKVLGYVNDDDKNDNNDDNTNDAVNNTNDAVKNINDNDMPNDDDNDQLDGNTGVTVQID